MIAVTPTLTTNLTARRRRNAFTLLEVLVVVAILVVLASVASIAVFKQLDDSKNDKARLDMQTLETAYKTLVLRTSGEVDSSNFQLGMLAQHIEQGEKGLVDPWGNQYQFSFDVDASGHQKIRFSATNPKTNETIRWPNP